MTTQTDASTDVTNGATLPAVIPIRRPTAVRVVEDVIPILDTARFEHMQRVAAAMAYCSLIPDCLKGESEKETAANCFLVVNQAVRWSMDPFAVAQCVSVIKGRLCHEGKLIAAVIEQKLGIKLKPAWAGEGERMTVTISGTFADGTTETVEGSVADWKTTRDGSPWVPKQYKKMLFYRGAREWCRIHAPGIILGVYSPDEMDDMTDEARARRARDVSEPPTPPEYVRPDSTITPSAQPALAAEDIANAEARPQPPTEVLGSPAALAAADAGVTGGTPHDADGVVWEEEGERAATPADLEPPSPDAPKAEPARAAIDTTEDANGTPAFLKRGPPKGSTSPETAKPKPAAKVEPDPFDTEQWLKDLDGACSGCETLDELIAVQNTVQIPAKKKITSKEAWERGKNIVLAASGRILGTSSDEEAA